MSVYETVANLTDKMVDAVRSNNWALLAQLEASCSIHIQAIKDNDVPVVLVREERAEKVRFINKILADDKKIRDILHPKSAQLGELMQRSGTHHKLNKAYLLDR
jgi:flagellar protein FliT